MIFIRIFGGKQSEGINTSGKYADKINVRIRHLI